MIHKKQAMPALYSNTRWSYQSKAAYESSVITRSHLSSKIFTASVNKTSGGSAPADSILTEEVEYRQISKVAAEIYLIRTLIIMMRISKYPSNNITEFCNLINH